MKDFPRGFWGILWERSYNFIGNVNTRASFYLFIYLFDQ